MRKNTWNFGIVKAIYIVGVMCRVCVDPTSRVGRVSSYNRRTIIKRYE
jgi:hypothetical protein